MYHFEWNTGTCIIIIHLPFLPLTTGVAKSTRAEVFSFISLMNNKAFNSHQNTFCKGGGVLIHHLIIILLTPPPPSPVLFIHSSPRTVVRLVALHILACHLVSPACIAGGLISSHIHIPLPYCSHCFLTVRPQHLSISLFISREEAG